MINNNNNSSIINHNLSSVSNNQSSSEELSEAKGLRNNCDSSVTSESNSVITTSSTATTTTTTSCAATGLSGIGGTMPVPGSVQGQNPTQGLVHWMSAVMAEHMTSNSHHDPTAVGMHYMWNGAVDVSILTSLTIHNLPTLTICIGGKIIRMPQLTVQWVGSGFILSLCISVVSVSRSILYSHKKRACSPLFSFVFSAFSSIYNFFICFLFIYLFHPNVDNQQYTHRHIS